MATRKAPQKATEALAPSKVTPTSRKLEDYSIGLDYYLTDGLWYGHLIALPEVEATAPGWSTLRGRLQDALEQYQRSHMDGADA